MFVVVRARSITKIPGVFLGLIGTPNLLLI